MSFNTWFMSLGSFLHVDWDRRPGKPWIFVFSKSNRCMMLKIHGVLRAPLGLGEGKCFVYAEPVKLTKRKDEPAVLLVYFLSHLPREGEEVSKAFKTPTVLRLPLLRAGYSYLRKSGIEGGVALWDTVESKVTIGGAASTAHLRGCISP